MGWISPNHNEVFRTTVPHFLVVEILSMETGCTVEATPVQWCGVTIGMAGARSGVYFKLRVVL
eukprot:8246259-Heterocapsa_arctica.AAC.1